MKQLKLGIKLPLAFGLALAVMLCAALYGVYFLNQALSIYQTEVVANEGYVIEVGEISGIFKSQVHDWKNVLLRGSKPEQLEKNWSAFVKQEAKVTDETKKLLLVLPAGEAKTLLEKFAQEHANMGANYRKGLELFKTANFEPAAGDQAVAGMDREPTRWLEEAGVKIRSANDKVVQSAAAIAHRSTLITIVLMLLVTLGSVVFGLWLSRGILREIGGEPRDALGLTQRVARGDLAEPIPLRVGDTGSLIAQLDMMQENLAKVVSEVRQGAESINIASAEIAQGNNDLSARTESQASALEETASSMEQLGATVKQNADSAQQANELARNASTVAVKGGDVVAQVVDTMKGINEASRKISDIIQVIDGIAFQTNILALNAAVEAARAGEQGRGFAVVASEVRSLAGRSAQAAKEIKSLINASVERVEQGTALVDQAGATMTEVVSSIHRVTDIMGEISAASREQASGVSQVGDAVTQMDQTTQQNAALVEEMAAAASSLREQARELVQTVAVFRLSENHLQSAPHSVATRTLSAPPARSAGARIGVSGAKKPAPKPAPKSLAAPATAIAAPASAKADGNGEWETF